jgi:hypothetical protein
MSHKVLLENVCIEYKRETGKDWLEDKFNYYNKELFGGLLAPAVRKDGTRRSEPGTTTVGMVKLKNSTLGGASYSVQFEYGESKLGEPRVIERVKLTPGALMFNESYAFNSIDHMTNTLIHEMCHLVQFYAYLEFQDIGEHNLPETFAEKHELNQLEGHAKDWQRIVDKVNFEMPDLHPDNPYWASPKITRYASHEDASHVDGGEYERIKQDNRIGNLIGADKKASANDPIYITFSFNHKLVPTGYTIADDYRSMIKQTMEQLGFQGNMAGGFNRGNSIVFSNAYAPFESIPFANTLGAKIQKEIGVFRNDEARILATWKTDRTRIKQILLSAAGDSLSLDSVEDFAENGRPGIGALGDDQFLFSEWPFLKVVYDKFVKNIVGRAKDADPVTLKTIMKVTGQEVDIGDYAYETIKTFLENMWDEYPNFSKKFKRALNDIHPEFGETLKDVSDDKYLKALYELNYENFRDDNKIIMRSTYIATDMM